jgi:hypothetical protein
MSKLPGFLLASACATAALAQTGSLSGNGAAAPETGSAPLASPDAGRQHDASSAMGSRQSADARQATSETRQLAAGDRLDRFFVDEDREHRPLDPEQRLASPDRGNARMAPRHREPPKRQER